MTDWIVVVEFCVLQSRKTQVLLSIAIDDKLRMLNTWVERPNESSEKN
jgi:hypothetical protein